MATFCVSRKHKEIVNPENSDPSCIPKCLAGFYNFTGFGGSESLEGQILDAIPEWGQDEKGVTLPEICAKTHIGVDTVAQKLEEFVRVGKIEEIVCEKGFARYRQCK